MNTQTIQQTAKIWKLFHIGAWFLWGTGTLALMGDKQGDALVGIAMLALGCVSLLVGKAGAWWNHE